MQTYEFKTRNFDVIFAHLLVFSMEFAKYAAVPRSVQEDLIKEYAEKRKNG